MNENEEGQETLSIKNNGICAACKKPAPVYQWGLCERCLEGAFENWKHVFKDESEDGNDGEDNSN